MRIKTTFKTLGDKSVTDYCRWLIKENVDPSTSLEVYRNLGTPDLTVKSIKEGAKLMLVENKNTGPVHKLFRNPFKQQPIYPTEWGFPVVYYEATDVILNNTYQGSQEENNCSVREIHHAN